MTVNQSVASAANMTGYEPLPQTAQSQLNPAPTVITEPGFNVFIRCPIPPIYRATSDSLRQFYIGAKVPQIRLFSPSTNVN